jgi:tRNA pseudouridine55 synthase
MNDQAGLLLLDKPQGLSSAQALNKVKRALGARSAGHTGTLDPLATGMLPLVFGDATRLSSYMLSADKAYRVTGQLGVCTDTLDAEGAVTRTEPVPAHWQSGLDAALAPLCGRILQIPPQYSALKREGRPAYERARAGETVELEAREVQIHQLKVIDAGVDFVELEVVCGKGTYIRSLIDDLGRALGCGAHVSMLRRLWVAPFTDAPMLSLRALLDDPAAAQAALQSPLAMIPHIPQISVDSVVATRLLNGQRVAGWHGKAPSGVVAVLTEGIMLALAELDQWGVLRPQRVFPQALKSAAPRTCR